MTKTKEIQPDSTRLVEIANAIIAQEREIGVSESEHQWLQSRLAEFPRDVPALRKLFAQPSIFED